MTWHDLIQHYMKKWLGRQPGAAETPQFDLYHGNVAKATAQGNNKSCRALPGRISLIMQWKDEYSIGIIEIDNQHKLLMQGFSVIEESIVRDKGWSDTHYAIVDLIKIARMHFTFEEALMRIFGYPGTESHQKEHLHFFAKLDSIERHSLKETAKIEIVTFMQDWLATHILVNDRGYAKHILSGAQVVRSGPVAFL